MPLCVGIKCRAQTLDSVKHKAQCLHTKIQCTVRVHSVAFRISAVPVSFLCHQRASHSVLQCASWTDTVAFAGFF